MDRFEVSKNKTDENNDNIYIPVWIDLKHLLYLPPKNKVLIYIPVWIDLKVCVVIPFRDLNPYLHSSMDRFEERAACKLAETYYNLHSSMDRFEV